MPFAVRDELQHGSTPKLVKHWICAPRHWLEFQPVAQPHTVTGIHRGEAEALQLALHVKAAAVLIDDVDGRNAAKELGLPTVGTIGILERAAERSRVDLPTVASALKTANFFVSVEILDAALGSDWIRKEK